MTASLDKRLTELEVRFSFIEQALQTLDGSVSAHERQLAQLRGVMERLNVELTQIRTALSHDVRDEPPPPHY